MATYDKEIDYEREETFFKLKEHVVYGSSRVGIRTHDLDLLRLQTQGFSMRSVHYSIGSRQYELMNHLGNVLSVVSDKVIPNFDHGIITEMRADIRVAQDYSPFGVTLSRRNFSVSEGYRYSVQNQEHIDEVKGKGNYISYKYRDYDPRIGRFMSLDPLASQYPHNSPYAFSENRVIDGVELEGLEYASAIKTAEKLVGFGYTHEPPRKWSVSGYSKIIDLVDFLDIRVSCFESCVVAYSQGNPDVAKYLNTNKMPVSRVPAMSWFKKGGEHHSFINASDFSLASTGDILFMGSSKEYEGHAALLASSPILSEDGNSFTVDVYTTYGNKDYNYDKTTYTFTKNSKGNWAHSGTAAFGNDGTGEILSGFGRVDEQAFMKEEPMTINRLTPKPLSSIKLDNGIKTELAKPTPIGPTQEDGSF